MLEQAPWIQPVFSELQEGPGMEWNAHRLGLRSRLGPGFSRQCSAPSSLLISVSCVVSMDSEIAPST